MYDKFLDWFDDLVEGVKQLVERIFYIIGPIFVMIAFGLTSFAIVIHFVHNIPFYAPYTHWSSLLHLSMGGYIAYCIGYNYIKAVVSSPGTPPSLNQGKAPSQADLGISDAEFARLRERALNPPPGAQRTPWCRACDIPKPPRAHHCHVCGTCVLKMDHHCPWIANCVGHRNHHYFILFLMYLWLGCAYASLMGFAPFIAAATRTISFEDAPVPRGAVIFSFIIASAVFVSMCIMLGWQVYVLVTNQTTIEVYINRMKMSEAMAAGQVYRNPYDRGLKANFQEFFGNAGTRWYAWLLPGATAPTGNGVEWTTRYQGFDAV